MIYQTEKYLVINSKTIGLLITLILNGAAAVEGRRKKTINSLSKLEKW